MDIEIVEMNNFCDAAKEKKVDNSCKLLSFNSNIPNCANEDVCTPDCIDRGQTSENMFNLFSTLYAQFLVILSGVSLFTELLQVSVALYEIHIYFYIYLLGIGIILLISSCARFSNSKESKSAYHHVKETAHTYINTGFRIAIILFGLLFLIETCLDSAVVFLAPTRCLGIVSSSLPILQGLFIILQMFFIMKYSKRKLNIFGCFRPIAIMHLAATNGALLIRLMLWEGAKDWESAFHLKHSASLLWEQNEINITVHALELNTPLKNQSWHSPNHVAHVTSHCWWRVPETEVTEDVTSIQMCLQNSSLGNTWNRTTQFLYPFVIQYCLVAVCFLSIAVRKVKPNIVQNHEESLISDENDNCRTCARSTKGLFVGVLILTTSIIMLICLTVHDMNFYIPFTSFYCIIFGSSICAAVAGLVQIRNLTTDAISNLPYDRQFMTSLQKIGIVAIYLYGSCNIIFGVISTDKLSILLSFTAALMILHAAIQYIFILQISTKRINQTNLDRKPGRQLVVFLVMCNFSLLLLESFTSKADINSLQLKTFGPIAWPVIMRTLVPFIVFHRFSSAVLLLEAWKVSYK